MGILGQQDIKNTSYVDLAYKGYIYTESQTIYNILKLSIQPLTPIISTLEYPLGDKTKVYPIGSLIPLVDFPHNKIKIKIKWKVSAGSLSLIFLTKEGVVLNNSGIYTKSTEYIQKESVIDIPPTAFYITLWNKNLNTAYIDYLELYSVEQANPLGLSKILLTDVDALKNSLKMWLFSRKGDYGRKLGKGGPLDSLLGKPINETSTEEIRTLLKDSIKEQFYNLTAEEIQIEEIPENRQYKINLYISDNINKFIVNIPILLQQQEG